MPIHPSLFQAALMAAVAMASLAACRQQTPPQPQAASAPTQVVPSSDLRGASDQADAPPAVGALTAGQASGGAKAGAVPPTGGDGGQAASAPASSASR